MPPEYHEAYPGNRIQSPKHPPQPPDQRRPILLLQRLFPHAQHPPACCCQLSVHQPVALLVRLSFLFAKSVRENAASIPGFNQPWP